MSSIGDPDHSKILRPGMGARKRSAVDDRHLEIPAEIDVVQDPGEEEMVNTPTGSRSC